MSSFSNFGTPHPDDEPVDSEVFGIVQNGSVRHVSKSPQIKRTQFFELLHVVELLHFSAAQQVIAGSVYQHSGMLVLMYNPVL